MANFSIRTSVQVVPIEQIAFADATQTASGIHSTIDRSFAASITTNCGTTIAKVQGGTTTIPGEETTFLSGFITGGTHLYYLYIKNTGASAITLKSIDGASVLVVSTINPDGFLVLTPEAVFSNLYLDNPAVANCTIDFMAYSYDEV
jgi:archaellum component FlaG (FlaF/FlaG flagellin family)